MSYPPSETTLANTRLPVSDAIKFNMADRVHRLSLAASDTVSDAIFSSYVLPMKHGTS